MFNFFKKRQSVLTENQLYLKAFGVNFAVHGIAGKILETLQEEVEDLKQLTEEESNKIFFVISYISLFRAQKFFWENFIKDEENAKIFESHLFDIYENTMGIDPRPHIKELVEYVIQGDPSREIEYVGKKICKMINEEGAILRFEISAIFAHFLKFGFYESLENAWNLPDEILQEMKDGFE